MTRLLTLLVLLAACPAAETLRIASCDPLLRPGLLFRCQVAGAVDSPGSLLVVCELRDRAQVLRQSRIRCQAPAAWQAGVVFHLIAPDPLPPRDLQLRLELWQEDQLLSETTRPVPTVDLWRRRLETHLASLRAAPTQRDALRDLWLEQALTFAQEPLRLDQARHWAQVLDALDQPGVQLPPEQTLPLDAFHAASDGSAQPMLLLQPAQARAEAPLIVHLDTPPRAVDKTSWASYQEARSRERLAPLLARGAAVLACYPAGDTAWQDLARWRVPQALAAARQRHPWCRRPAVLVASGRAAAAGIALTTADPSAWQALILDRPRALQSDPPPQALPAQHGAWWQLLHDPLAGLPQGGSLPILVIDERLPDQLAAAPGLRWYEDFQDAVWAQIQAPHKLPTRCDFLAALPGSCGDLQILAATRWGEPIRISTRWEPPQLHITASNARHFAWPHGDELIVNSTPQAASAPPAGEKSSTTLSGLAREYATDAFVAVIGTGEHAAARARNEANAAHFRAAWIAHAQGAPRLLSDQEYDPAALPLHHLVCFGNPRSHRVLAALFPDEDDLPLRLSARDVILPDGSHWLRASTTWVLSRPHPQDPTRLVLIVDGVDCPSLLGPGLPFGPLPDATIIRHSGDWAQALAATDWHLLPFGRGTLPR